MENNFVLFTWDMFLSNDIYFVIILIILATNKVFFRQIKAIISLVILCLGITYLFNLCKDYNTMIILINSRIDNLLMILLPKLSNMQPSKALPNYEGINIIKVIKASYIRFTSRVMISPVKIYVKRVKEIVTNILYRIKTNLLNIKTNYQKKHNDYAYHLQFT